MSACLHSVHEPDIKTSKREKPGPVRNSYQPNLGMRISFPVSPLNDEPAVAVRRGNIFRESLILRYLKLEHLRMLRVGRGRILNRSSAIRAAINLLGQHRSAAISIIIAVYVIIPTVGTIG